LKQILTNPAIIGSDAPSAKHDRLLDIVEELHESKQKVIIFTQFEEIEIESLTKLLHKFNPAVVTGKVDDWKPQERKFWNDPTCTVFLGTSQKCREGLNLQCASYVIFLDLEWAPSYIAQCEDRARRIGSRSNLTIIRLLIRNTVDEYIINKILKVKQAIFDSIVEGKSSLSHDDIESIVASL
jgi:SNF2 family DNA or RNA helicase